MSGEFFVRGPVPLTRYIHRSSDRQLDQYLRLGDYITVIGPRFSGKTSLLMRKFKELQANPGYVPVFLFLSSLASYDSPAWYQALHNTLREKGLGINYPLAHNERDLYDVLLDALNGEVAGRKLVIMLDDVQAIPASVLVPVMTMIRQTFDIRQMVEAFRRCIFMLAGNFLPDDLISDRRISPFNIAQRIYTTDADLEGVRQLAGWLQRPDRILPYGLAERVYYWTAGHLYLSQKLCHLLDSHDLISLETVDEIATEDLPQDEYFGRVVELVEEDERLQQILISIQMGRAIRFSRLQKRIARAWLAGIVREDENGNCTIRNRVYQAMLYNLDVRLVRPPDADEIELSQRKTEGLSIPPGITALQNGRYLMERLTTTAGMAEIWRGTDRSNGDTVAIKRLKAEFNDDAIYIERFWREGETLRKLNDHARHPHIVRFVDLFMEENRHYIVMEYVRGGNLSQLLHREGLGLPLAQVVKIVLGVAAALDFIHQFGIVHRDIKPENILLAVDLSPRLADFGIAFVDSAARLTKADKMLGTLHYLSPEMCDGRGVDARADLWSVGVMLFEMLTGDTPFRARDNQHEARVIQDILHAPIPDIAQLRPGLPGQLCDIVKNLLQRDPSLRCPSAAQLVQALSAVPI